MKKFLIKLIIFSTAVVVVMSALYFGIDHMLKKKFSSFWKLKVDKTIIFAGDSNIQWAIDDSYIPNSINFAQSGESYIYTYSKLKLLLKNNPQIKKVFLGYSYHNLQGDWAQKRMFENDVFFAKVKIFDLFMAKPEKMVFIDKKPLQYLETIPSIIQYDLKLLLFKSVRKNSLKIYGGYKANHDHRLKVDIDSLFSIRDYMKRGFSQYQLEYLKKISDLCRESNVELILLKGPKYPLYENSIDPEIKQFYKKFADSALQKRTVADFGNLPLPDSCFRDMVHLNDDGARLFSIYLSKYISGKDSTDLNVNP